MNTRGDDYGQSIDKYIAYTNAEKGMEVEIGRRPALKRFSDLHGLTVLDFGCGPGTNAADLRRYGAKQVVGIDREEEELKVAQGLDPEGAYLHYDGIHLADAIEASGYDIDAILASFSFCTIPSADLGLILKEMRKVLAKDGELVIIDPNFEHSLGVHYPGELHYHPKANVQTDDHLCVTLGEGEGAKELYHDIYRSHADLRKLLTEAGFIIETFEEVLPSDSCQEGWAELARKYPPFLLIKAH